MTISNVRYTLSTAAILAVVAAAFFSYAVPRTQALTTIESGDLIRGESFTAVYYMGEDGFRYVFPNDKAYFTWYTDFSDVKFITDVELAKIQIGGNVTYKPGVKMIKINTDPKTYAVDAGGTLRHVTTEAIAVSLYGANWNTKIDDIADGFFSNYNIGSAISSPTDFVPATVTSSVLGINDDKGLIAPEYVSISDSGYAPLNVTVVEGQGVRFTNNSSAKHTATADDLSWGTGTLNQGESFIRGFDQKGTYTFFDSYNSANTGAVFVE